MKLKKVLSVLFLSAVAIPVCSLTVNAATNKTWSEPVKLTKDTTVTGNLTVKSSVDLNGFKLVVNKNLYGSGTINVNGGTLEVLGDMTESSSVYVDNGTLKVGGNYFQTSSTLDLNNGRVEVGGDFRLQSVNKNDDGTVYYGSCYGELKMDDENDYFVVGGDFFTQSNYGNGSGNNHLTNGTLELKGDFTQINGNSYNFDASENHKIIFSGDDLQTVIFQSPGSSGFNILAGTKNKNVDIRPGRINAIGAATTIRSFEQYGTLDVNGKSFTVSNDFTQHGNVNVNEGTMKVLRHYSHQDGCLDLNNGTLRVSGNYRLQSVTTNDDGTVEFGSCYGYLKMNDKSDYFVVGGNFCTQSNYGDGANNNDLTNGKLVLKGDFTQLNGNSYNFNCKDNHKVLFYGTGKQTVTFASTANSGFATLSTTDNTDVDIVGRISKIGTAATIANFVQSGSLDVNGKDFTVSGNFIQYGNVSLNKGSVKVLGDYSHRDGCLDFNNGSLRVTGDYRLQSVTEKEGGKVQYGSCYGYLKMNDPSDYFLVSGNFYAQSNYGDGSTNNDLTNGKLVLKGNFTQLNGNSYNFNCKDNHKVLFYGSKKQTISFESAVNSGFNILSTSTNKNVVLSQARIRTIGVDSTINSMVEYGTMDLNGKTLTVTDYFKQKGDVNVNSGTLKVGSYYMHNSGCLDLNNGRVEVGGNYRLQESYINDKGKTAYSSCYGYLKMNDENDYFLVNGNFYFHSNYGDGATNNDLTNGTLELKGSFYEYCGNSYNFNCKDNHKVLFSGTKLQTISFESTTNSGFNTLSATENVRVDIKAGRINTIGGTDLEIESFTQYGSLDMAGNTLNIAKDLNQFGSITLSGGQLNVAGSYYHRDGCLDINNGKISVNGDYRLQGIDTDSDGNTTYSSCYGYLKMNDANDYFLVNGSFYTQSNYGDGASNNDLTNGTLELKGDFNQLCGNSYNFNSKNDHKVIFSGDTQQKIHFQSAGNSGFNLLYSTPNTDVDITSARINRIGSNITVLNFTQYGNMDVDGNTITITNDFTQYGNITVNCGKLIVLRDYYHSDGCLDIDNGRVEVGRDYRLQSVETDTEGETVYGSCYGYLKMNDESDYMLVKGNMYVQSNYGDGATNNDLTNGKLELKGDFTQLTGNSYNFNCKDNHKVIFTGSTVQNVSFKSAGNSGFNNLYRTTNKNINITSGRINLIGRTATGVKNFTQYGNLDINAKAFTVSGTFTQHGNVDVNKGQFTVSGYYYHSDGCLDINNGKLTVGKNYRLQSIGKDDNGKTTYGSCYGYLKMNDPGDYMLVKGNMFVQSNYGDGAANNDLTNGILELKGSFYQYSGNSYNFNAKDQHKVVFSGSSKQTVKFESTVSSGFNNLYSTPNKNIVFTAARINTLGSNVSAVSFRQYGTLELNRFTFKITGKFVQEGNVLVNKGVLDVAGDYSQHNGMLDLNNGTVKVGGNYNLRGESTDNEGNTYYTSCYGYLKMNDRDDYFVVMGNFYIQSNYGDGAANNDITDGTLELHGNFYQYNGNGYCFRACGNHKTHFVGDNNHEAYFQSKQSHLNIVMLDHSLASGYLFGSQYYYWKISDEDNIFNLSRLDYDYVVLGEDATLSLVAFGGKPSLEGYFYKIEIKEVSADEYTELRGFSPETTFSFKPAAFGKYIVSVTAIDSEFHTSVTEMQLEVVDALVNTSTVSTDSLTLGETLVVNGSAENGVGAYEFALYSKSSDQSDYTLVSNFSNNPIINYVPSLPGTYTLKVVVKDMKGHTEELTFPLVVENNLTNDSTISTGLVRFGGTAVVTGVANGGVPSFKYAFYIKTSKATKWTTIQNYGMNSVVNVTPEYPGNYIIRVNIKDASGKVVKKDLELTVENPPELKNNTTLSATEIDKGQSVDVIFAAADGVAPYKYQVYYKLSTKKTWSQACDYTTDSQVSITPQNSGEYTIRVKVKDTLGNIVKKDITLKVNAIVPTNTSTVSADVISQGETVTVNASAEGGVAPYTYGVWYRLSGSSSWTKVTDYADNSVISFVIMNAGTYEVRVNVKDSAGNVDKKDFNVTVEAIALANTSTISAESINKGDSVTVNASALGGTSPYKYGVWYKKTSASSWTKARDYESGKTITVTPKYAAEYTIRVNVKDASGEIDKKDFIVNVT